MKGSMKDIKSAQKVFEEKGFYESNWVTAGSLSRYITGIEANKFFPAVLTGVETICYFEDIDGEITLGYRKNAGDNCMDVSKLNFEDKVWIPKDKLFNTAWKKLIKEFDKEVFKITSPDVFYAKLRNNRYVFWEPKGDVAYLYEGIQDEDHEKVLFFAVGEIKDRPTADKAGRAQSGRRDDWGVRITLPKKHDLVPWEEIKKEIQAVTKELIIEVIPETL